MHTQLTVGVQAVQRSNVAPEYNKLIINTFIFVLNNMHILKNVT